MQKGAPALSSILDAEQIHLIVQVGMWYLAKFQISCWPIGWGKGRTFCHYFKLWCQTTTNFDCCVIHHEEEEDNPSITCTMWCFWSIDSTRVMVSNIKGEGGFVKQGIVTNSYIFGGVFRATSQGNHITYHNTFRPSMADVQINKKHIHSFS